MRIHSRRARLLGLMGLFVAAVLAPIAAAADGDLVVQCAIVEAHVEGPVEVGTLRIDVLNTTGSAINNVDLRLEDERSTSLPARVAQLGAIAPGEAQSTTVRYLKTESDGDVLQWRVDYDDAAGSHHRDRVTVQATEAVQQ